MDIVLARTFLEIIAAGSFAAAAEQLHVTQSAVSIRIQKLEEELGEPLFTRSKSGVELTAQGHEFEAHARTFVQVWDEARYSIAVPERYRSSLSIACQPSLWPELSINWLEMLEREMPDIAFTVHIGPPERLTHLLTRGLCDIAVLYTPELRPGVQAQYLMDDSLIHVSTNPDHAPGLDENYVFIDWGREFVAAHSRWYPDYKLSRINLQIGAAAVPFIVRNRRSAYLPYRVADDFVVEGALHLVPDAPEMPFPAYAVWTEARRPELIRDALALLDQAAAKAPILKVKGAKNLKRRRI